MKHAYKATTRRPATTRRRARIAPKLFDMTDLSDLPTEERAQFLPRAARRTSPIWRAIYSAPKGQVLTPKAVQLAVRRISGKVYVINQVNRNLGAAVREKSLRRTGRGQYVRLA